MKNALKLLAGVSVVALMLRAMAPDEEEHQVLEQAEESAGTVPEPEIKEEIPETVPEPEPEPEEEEIPEIVSEPEPEEPEIIPEPEPEPEEPEIIPEPEPEPEPEPVEEKSVDDWIPVYEKPKERVYAEVKPEPEKEPVWVPVYEKPKAKSYHGTAFGNPYIGAWKWKSILVDDDFVEAEDAFGSTVTLIKENGDVLNNGKMVGTWVFNGDSLEIIAGDIDGTATIDGTHIAICGLDNGNMIMVVNVDGKGKLGSIFCVKE